MKDKTVLITGGTGSLGLALTENLLRQGASIIIYSRDEKKQYDMKQLFPQCTYILGDIRDYASIRDAVRGVDIVIHAASLKYVDISEIQPSEYITTNVNGTLNLINAVLDEKTIQHCVGISTDKACLPVNTYGLTKALLEKTFLEADRRQGENGTTIFNVARYGNVIGTRGSVVPFWKQRREAGLSLPITNGEMTRFFFTLDEAVDLILYSFQTGSGKIISKAMKGVKLKLLADVMKGDSWVEDVGERPGEKHDEMLLSPDEILRTVSNGDYFCYTPSKLPSNKNPIYRDGYSSSIAKEMTTEELQFILREYL